MTTRLKTALARLFRSDQETRRSTTIVCDTIAAVLICSALVLALDLTRDLRGTFDPDHFRDIAQAQAALDGHPLSDPYYKNEWAWYNPLLAWTLAAGAIVTGWSVEEFHVHAGPWLNLLGPIAFYLLARRLTRSRFPTPAGALVALALYLFFVTTRERSWESSTYSPWLYSDNFAEGLFFSSTLAMLHACERRTVLWAAVAGALIGLTFLAHAAPAGILAIVAVVVWLREWRMLVAAGTSAIVISSPFLGVIALHYRFHVLHSEPLTFQSSMISPTGLLPTLKYHWLLLAMAAGGLWRLRSRIVVAWLLVAFALTIYAIFPLYPLMPAFHFWIYVVAALTLLAGAFAGTLVPNAFVVSVLVLAAASWHWPEYRSRPDIQYSRYEASTRRPEHIAAAKFLRTVTAPDDVVVGNRGVVYLIVGTAGRKTLAPDSLFANPYREFESRAADRDALLKAIERGDRETALGIAARRDVAAAAMSDAVSCGNAAKMFALTWQLQGDICVSLLRDRQSGP